MHVHVGRKKRHAVQPSVRCCLPANGTSPKYSSTLSVDMLLSDRDTLDNDPLLASREPPAGNCNKSSSVSVSMSRDRRLYTCQQVTPRYMHFSSPVFPFIFFAGVDPSRKIHYRYAPSDRPPALAYFHNFLTNLVISLFFFFSFGLTSG